MINNHWSGFLRFSLSHNENQYTNTKTFKYFCNYFCKEQANKSYTSQQLVGGILFLRKTRFVIDFFEEMLNILDSDPYLFSDKYTKYNENHRHDQSISSMLYKIMGGNLIISDETYPVNKDFPINASRLN